MNKRKSTFTNRNSANKDLIQMFHLFMSLASLRATDITNESLIQKLKTRYPITLSICQEIFILKRERVENANTNIKSLAFESTRMNED